MGCFLAVGHVDAASVGEAWDSFFSSTYFYYIGQSLAVVACEYEGQLVRRVVVAVVRLVVGGAVECLYRDGIGTCGHVGQRLAHSEGRLTPDLSRAELCLEVACRTVVPLLVGHVAALCSSGAVGHAEGVEERTDVEVLVESLTRSQSFVPSSLYGSLNGSLQRSNHLVDLLVVPSAVAESLAHLIVHVHELIVKLGQVGVLLLCVVEVLVVEVPQTLVSSDAGLNFLNHGGYLLLSSLVGLHVIALLADECACFGDSVLKVGSEVGVEFLCLVVLGIRHSSLQGEERRVELQLTFVEERDTVEEEVRHHAGTAIGRSVAECETAVSLCIKSEVDDLLTPLSYGESLCAAQVFCAVVGDEADEVLRHFVGTTCIVV